MGASGKWFKSLLSNNKTDQVNYQSLFYFSFFLFCSCVNNNLVLFQEKKCSSTKKKWKLWKTSSSSSTIKKSGGAASVSDSSITDTAAAVAVVVRAAPKDFILIRQEWAAIRIQALFRAFLVTIKFFFTRSTNGPFVYMI